MDAGADPAPVLHTFSVHGFTRSIVITAMLGALSSIGAPGAAPSWKSAVDLAARTAPEARIVVLDLASDHLLASHSLSGATHTLAEPGSTLKPVVLYGLVAEGRWNPDRRIACSRALVVAGRRLACAHPPAAPFNAHEALTWSCNSYFAEVARSLAPGELGRLLRPTGLLAATGLAPAEVTAEFREPTNVDATELALLGVEGIRVTPLELAMAYRWLALQLAAHPDSQAARVVRAGIEDSANFGMARSASVPGASIAGKTGTAKSATSNQTHGWFAGLSPAQNPQVVIVVYLPGGRGVDAASIAAAVLAHSPSVRR